MGKIVKAARVLSEKYIVGIPHAQNGNGASHPIVAFNPFESALESTPGSFAQPEAHAEPKVDYAALARDADAILEEAAANAEGLIRQAESAALKLVELAQSQGSSLEEQSRVRGYDAGFAAGKAAGDADMSEMVHTLHGLIESLRDQRASAMESAEPELVRLAMSIAERVVHDQISADPNVVVENVRSALTRLVSREVVTLRVHPSDLETMRQHRDAIVAVSDVEHLRIVEDQRVDRGGVVVETDAGTIDAKIATQLREARRAVRVGDETPA